jgi:hypothetical protein
MGSVESDNQGALITFIIPLPDARWAWMLLSMEAINHDNNKVKIHSTELLSALKKLHGMLGRVLVECIVTSLEHHGIDLRDKSKFYSLNEIQEAFNKMFGTDASQLLLQRLKRELRHLCKGGE